MQLVDRDYMILESIFRFRFLQSRQIRLLVGFAGQRACDRRLQKLRVAELIKREKVLYKVASLYTLTERGKDLIHQPKKEEKIRLDNIYHDIALTDSVIYFSKKYLVGLKNFTTEKELHKIDGFAVRKHRPDFIFTKNQKTFCVEIEFSLKAKLRLENNIKENFMNYDYQIFIVHNTDKKLINLLKSYKESYNLIIFDMEVIDNYVRSL